MFQVTQSNEASGECEPHRGSCDEEDRTWPQGRGRCLWSGMEHVLDDRLRVTTG